MVTLGNLFWVKETMGGGARICSRFVGFRKPCSFHCAWLHTAQPFLRIGNLSVKWEAKVDELKDLFQSLGYKSKRCHWDVGLGLQWFLKVSYKPWLIDIDH